jgi:GNAT superfamily N-acetyltransferase
MISVNTETLLNEGFLISTDKTKLDNEVIWQYLTRSYWFKGVKKPLIEKLIKNSLCFGVYHQNKQIGFARIVSDFGTFAYLADVFILEEYRGRGLSKWLMIEIMNHPDLKGLRRIMLATRDAHGLYAQFGFNKLEYPDRYMEVYYPDAHLK